MLGFFSTKKKTFTANVNSGASTVTIDGGENLLNAALRAGLAWPHNCKVGSCGTCRCRLVSGKIKPLNDFSYVLDADELDAGTILACQTRARSDLAVEVILDQNAATLAQAQNVGGTIKSSTPLTHDIFELTIELQK